MKKVEKKLAIIDIGSNTIRLVIYLHKEEYVLKEIENIKVSARLQNYLNNEQILTSEGLRILKNTLKLFKEIVSLHKGTLIKVFATAAIRQAKNKEEIKKSIRDEIGLSVDILSGEKEAFYGFLGVIHSTWIQDGITIDIGGGSTEITQFLNRKMVHSHSFPFGALTLKKQFIKEKVPTSDEMNNLAAFLQSKFLEIDWLENCRLPIVGIGGSARNLGKIDQAMKSYPIDSIHQYEINLKDILTVKEKLTSLSFSELQNVEGLSKERADIIIPAIEVFLTIYQTVDAPFFQFSQKGIREGILFNEIRDDNNYEYNNQLPLEKSLRQLAVEYEIDLEKRSAVTKTVMMLLDSLRKTGIFEVNENDIHDLRCASYIYNLGEFIERDSASQHTFYILSTRNMDGVSHRDRIKIALLTSYHSKTSFKQNVQPFKEWFTKQERHKLRVFGALLKFSFILNSTKREIVQGLRLLEGKDHIHLELYCNKSWTVEQQEAEKQIKHLENALGKSIILDFKWLS
ncbi:Ppx/GppA family phosphatase [Bacillus methanolicus]|uniref:Ppx/GppA phosphatase family protein n=1 Tax=Bacillus methanolicus TaxID=1471 RepID=UPI00237FF2D1|nr:Ppx/GppA phosphatase family protein [Bacillus methanolicus]MDE3839615.1 Ppx/GppA family phosphatase [Bacillus methanolicus]